jgi:hypothetical protein
MRIWGGVQTYWLTDNERTVSIDDIAGIRGNERGAPFDLGDSSIVRRLRECLEHRARILGTEDRVMFQSPVGRI